MALTDAQNERLSTILQNLEPELKNLGQSSRTFVEDQIKRHERWGEDMKLSPKQWAWLEDLYAKHCGGEKEVNDEPLEERDEDPRGEQPDIDDEIKF